MEKVKMIAQIYVDVAAACSSSVLAYNCIRLYQISKPRNDGRKRGEGAGEIRQHADNEQKGGCDSCDNGFYRELACRWYRVKAAGILFLVMWFHDFLTRV